MKLSLPRDIMSSVQHTNSWPQGLVKWKKYGNLCQWTLIYEALDIWTSAEMYAVQGEQQHR